MFFNDLSSNIIANPLTFLTLYDIIIKEGVDSMAQTNMQIRIDENLKEDFVKLCDELGLTVTTACCAFIKKSVAEQRIPFELSIAKSNPNKENKD